MEFRLPESLAPFFTPDHQGNDREEEREKDSGEREPCPEVANRCRERQREEAHDEGEAAAEVEQHARLCRLRLIRIRDVGVERRARDLEAEDADAQADERDLVVPLRGHRCAEDDEAGGHEERGQRAEVESVFGLALAVVPLCEGGH